VAKTAEEISKATGFSVTTIRFVLNGQAEKYRISAATQQRINDYIAIHGYSVNYAARSLKLKRSDTIGLVVPDLDNAFFAALMAALEVRCRQRDLLLLTVASHDDPQLENRAVSTLLARGVDGLVIAPCQAATLPQLIKMKSRVSVVMFDRNFKPSLFPTVVSDNFQGGLDMTRRMLSEAGEPCYFLCGDSNLPSIQDRVRGFEAACAEHGIVDAGRLILLETENSPAAGRHAMQALIENLGRMPRAFMCSSLKMLEGALQQLKLLRGEIDKDILLATFDDHAMLDFLPNRVLSIKQNESALAQQVFERLTESPAERKENNPCDIVPTELIYRNF
jgi:LacI family fructose operon transcriptional repressor